MPVLGFNISKVQMEKSSSVIVSGSIEVNITPSIKEVRLGEIRTPTGKMNGIEVLFEYVVRYSPEIARGSVEGALLYVPPDRNKVDDILNLWEDEKKIDPTMFAEAVNFITKEVTPLLMILSKEMRLPYHVPIPRVEIKRE